MGKFGGFLLLKLIELKLLLLLFDTYGGAQNTADVWAIFKAQSELAQIGAITSLIAVSAILAVTLRRIVFEIIRVWRWFRRPPGSPTIEESAPGD